MKLKTFGYVVATVFMLLTARMEGVHGKGIYAGRAIETSTTSTDLRLTQQSEPLEIVDVRVVQSDDGIDLVIDTTSGTLARPFFAIEGNALIADIDNAVLATPTGSDFRLESPAPGFEIVEVTQQSPQQVRIQIIGSETTPTAEVATDSQRLIISAVSSLATAQAEDEGSVDDTVDGSADDPEDFEDLGGLRLIVTAEKRPDEVQDVPLSITAFSTEEIEDDDITSLEEIAGSTPNFTAYTPDRSFFLYSIRGLSNLNFLSRDSAAFYIDDVPYDYNGFLDLDLTDLEQIEVLRGPQSTLYGRNAIAGVVNINTRRPTNEPEYRISSSIGNFVSPDIRASASGPIIEDSLFYRLSGDFKQRDGFLINVNTGEDVDFETGGSGRAQLLWEPSDSWDLLLNTSFDRYRDGTLPIGRPDLDRDPSETDSEFEGFNNLDTNAQSLSVNYENSSLRFTSITARRFSGQELENDSDGTDLDVIEQLVDIDSTVLSQELRLQSAAEDGPFLWLVGAYFEDRNFNVNQEGFRFGSDFAFGPGLSLTRAFLDEQTYAIFGQASYRPVEPITLTAGLRYEIFNSTLEDSEVASGATFSDESNNGSEFLPRFALEYDVTPDIMAYGSVSRGYRAQGVNFRASVPEQLFFDEEKSWNYEAGIRSSFLQDRLTANLSVFHNPIRDFQVPSTDPATGLFGFVDNADVTINGLELELRARPINGLNLTAGLGLLDATYTDYVDPNLGNFTGNRLTYSPNYTFNLAAQYRSLDGLFGRLELQGFGSTFFDDGNTLEQSPYVLVNARAGYEIDERRGFYLFANNIFDYRPLTSQVDFIGGTLPSTFGAPANFGIQYRMEF
ncbi:MAG: TonB-dependent receptor [Cyanobacteria bacterium P01_D01_bin.1]